MLTVSVVSPDPSRNLPARPTLHAGQALDCYLEHAADANHIPPATVMRAITDACDTTRYVLLRPTPRTLEVLSGLTGQSTAALTAATLAAVDGTLLDLSGLDPHHQPSYRAVAARGWAPGQGTQICPRCLAETGTWDISWRIPHHHRLPPPRLLPALDVPGLPAALPRHQIHAPAPDRR